MVVVVVVVVVVVTLTLKYIKESVVTQGRCWSPKKTRKTILLI